VSKIGWGSLAIGFILGFVVRHYLKGRAQVGG